MSEYAIETKGLTKKYGNKIAVDHVDLKIPKGSVYGFIGPNGAGKTTTLRMLTSLAKKTSGEIYLDGQLVSYGKDNLNFKIGFLPDTPSFYKHMNAIEFMKLTGEIFGLPKKEILKRSEMLLEKVGLEPSKKKISQYSRGMKQRLGIAQALMNKPKVLLLDEPTSALDPIGRKEVMDIIKNLSKDMTVLFSTHILDDIERICDRAVILNSGKILMEDSLEKIKERYAKKGVIVETVDEESLLELKDNIEMNLDIDSISINEGKIEVYFREESNINNKILKIAVDRHISIKYFSRFEANLEDVFMKVVRENA